MISTSKKSIAFGILFAGVLASVAAILQSGWTSTTNPATARSALAVPGLAVNNSFSGGNTFTSGVTNNSAAGFKGNGAGLTNLSAANWTGSVGTSNYVAKFGGSSNIVNSAIFESGGNVGVGTAAPGAKMHLYSSTSDARLKMETTAASNAGVLLTANGNGWYIDNRGNADTPNNRLAFNSGGEWMTILDTGNVGIGTTTPTSGRLVVDGGGITFGTDNTYPIGASGDNRPSQLFVGTGDSSVMGKLGVGTVSPARVFHVVGTPPMRVERSGVAAFDWSITGVTPNSAADLVFTSVTASTGFGFRTMNGSSILVDAVVIDRDGNVGINTVVPNAKLHVLGDANIRTNIAQFDVTITDFVIGTRYTNSNRRAFVAASFTLNGAAAGTAAVTLNVEQSGVTNVVKCAAGPLASLTTVEQLSLMVGPGAFYYFTDATSGVGASVAIVAGTSSLTGF